MRLEEYQAAVRITTVCTGCAAREGQMCTTEHGDLVSYVHNERSLAYEESIRLGEREVISALAERSRLREALAERNSALRRLQGQHEQLQVRIVKALSSRNHFKVSREGAPYCSCGVALVPGEAIPSLVVHLLEMLQDLTSKLERALQEDPRA